MSGFQVEMGKGPIDPNSDWFKWVHDPKNIKLGIVSGDLPEDGPGFWELYHEDLLRAKRELNNNAIRLSVEWSRIFPTPPLMCRRRLCAIIGEILSAWIYLGRVWITWRKKRVRSL